MAGMGSLSEEHEELYGALLAADQVVSDSGSGWLLFGAIGLTIGLVVGIEFEWFDDVLGRDLAKLRHWGVYIGIGVIMFFAFGALVQVTETMAYRRVRGEIHREVRSAGLSWNALLARTAEDQALKNLVEKLRKDDVGRDATDI